MTHNTPGQVASTAGPMWQGPDCICSRFHTCRQRGQILSPFTDSVSLYRQFGYQTGCKWKTISISESIHVSHAHAQTRNIGIAVVQFWIQLVLILFMPVWWNDVQHWWVPVCSSVLGCSFGHVPQQPSVCILHHYILGCRSSFSSSLCSPVKGRTIIWTFLKRLASGPGTSQVTTIINGTCYC